MRLTCGLDATPELSRRRARHLLSPGLAPPSIPSPSSTAAAPASPLYFLSPMGLARPSSPALSPGKFLPWHGGRAEIT